MDVYCVLYNIIQVLVRPNVGLVYSVDRITENSKLHCL